MVEQINAPSAVKTRTPVVVVDDLHVDYRVYVTGKRVRNASSKLFKRGRATQTVHALKGVSFTAYQNESIGVIGHNGSGKSTLMRAIVGLTPASKGAVYASSRPNLLGVGAALIRDLSGEQNIILGGLAMGFTIDEIEARRDEIVEFTDMQKFINMPMRTYSSGMAARLKFAIATSRAHEILIVDEALAVGDKEFRAKSEDRIREIREAAGTVFLVSHSMSSIRSTCDRVLWINEGELVMDGPTEEVVPAYQESRRDHPGKRERDRGPGRNDGDGDQT
ncbi:ABC transporter ATP-binding protein [Spelaeicoccus albus]|uniref:Teichoic acid transport system ATP-binding protein n=1 Tax=Spelaeicoccus albus TaxID=1280376 RepID=A0A7Z0AAQ9_9MICO|nr:ATP-binding cassette domain-containing protein [Spelaeicoccus albus]NYI66440.1 teichoic acid transport system ATP-binding protein [Spelaeicoccus albus]